MIHLPRQPEYKYTDAIAISTTRNYNEYRSFGVDDTYTTLLIINGEEIKITAEQGQALLRNSREVAQASKQATLKLLADNLSRFDYSNNACDALSFDDFVKMTER
jgi:hypothetical protein